MGLSANQSVPAGWDQGEPGASLMTPPQACHYFSLSPAAPTPPPLKLATRKADVVTKQYGLTFFFPDCSYPGIIFHFQMTKHSLQHCWAVFG